MSDATHPISTEAPPKRGAHTQRARRRSRLLAPVGRTPLRLPISRAPAFYHAEPPQARAPVNRVVPRHRVHSRRAARPLFGRPTRHSALLGFRRSTFPRRAALARESERIVAPLELGVVGRPGQSSDARER